MWVMHGPCVLGVAEFAHNSKKYLRSQQSLNMPKRSSPATVSEDHVPPQKQVKQAKSADERRQEAECALGKIDGYYNRRCVKETLGEDKAEWVTRAREWLEHDHEKDIKDIMKLLGNLQKIMENMRPLKHDEEPWDWDESGLQNVYELQDIGKRYTWDAENIRANLSEFMKCVSN